MKIEHSDKYILLTPETSFNIFFDNAYKLINNSNTSNIIIDLTNIDVNEGEVKSLDQFAEIQITNKQSFVVILSSFDADVFDEELNIVPTLTEAIDIIDMDDITRDLGF